VMVICHQVNRNFQLLYAMTSESSIIYAYSFFLLML